MTGIGITFLPSSCEAMMAVALRKTDIQSNLANLGSNLKAMRTIPMTFTYPNI